MNQESLTNQINQLRSTLGKIEHALGTVDEAIVWTDEQGRVQWCNSAFNNLVGQIHLLVLGKQLLDLFPLRRAGQLLNKSDHPFKITVDTKTKNQGCYEFIKDSQTLTLEISGSPLEFPSSSPSPKEEVCAVLVIRNITENQQTAQALQQANEELERRVAERTQELSLANEQLQQELAERHRAESELQATSSRLSALIQNLQAGVLVENEARKIVLINQEFCSLFGIPAPPQALIGYDCEQAAQSTKQLFQEPARFIERVAEILQQKQIVTNEELLLQDGRILERDYVPIFIENSYYGHFWLYRDITERKITQKTIQKNNDLLKIISSTQSQFITASSADSLFDGLLENLLQLTKSEYGFIGEFVNKDFENLQIEEVYVKRQGEPSLKIPAIEYFIWNQETGYLQDKKGEFPANKFFREVMITRKPVIFRLSRCCGEKIV